MFTVLVVASDALKRKTCATGVCVCVVEVEVAAREGRVSRGHRPRDLSVLLLAHHNAIMPLSPPQLPNKLSITTH